MTNNLFFSNINENEKNRKIINEIKDYVLEKGNIQVYLITSPLGENKYTYSYEENVIVILSPKHKIIFLDLNNDDDKFDDYYDEFIEDLGSISDKFNYKKYIGRPKKWKDSLTLKKNTKKKTFNPYNKPVFSFKNILSESILPHKFHRQSELLISLLVGSVNDLGKIGEKEPETLLEKIKNKIVLFDGDQTRFIYEGKKNKEIHIQGLAGTGKTELLLHKLKEIYLSSNDSKIYFTCKNIALSRELNKRIPEFFNFMKVEKQIEKNKRLWVTNARGSIKDINSGLYRYLCSFYNIPFFTYGQVSDFEKVIEYALNEISKINEKSFEYAFDYILIDESQDFPDNFFTLCNKVTREQLYVAGDLFQDIFNNHIETRSVQPDYILNKCYRTDPKTLMFAQAIGMGLFETPHLNWLQDESWNDIGYIIERLEKNIYLSREPIRRFDDLDNDKYSSMNIITVENDYIDDIINTIEKIREKNSTLTPDDIGVIYLDNDYKYFCSLANKLELKIYSKYNWQINKAHENKEKISNRLFISNKNHVKGLEFPFVICITNNIQNTYGYRNALYTMLTRSFLQSYLLVKEHENLKIHIDGLEIINEKKYIKTIEPTESELKEIKETIINYNKNKKLSYRDFIIDILKEIKLNDKIDSAIRLLDASRYKQSFDIDSVKEFLINNKKHL